MKKVKCDSCSKKVDQSALVLVVTDESDTFSDLLWCRPCYDATPKAQRPVVRLNPSRPKRMDDDTPGYYSRLALATYRRTGE